MLKSRKFGEVEIKGINGVSLESRLEKALSESDKSVDYMAFAVFAIKELLEYSQQAGDKYWNLATGIVDCLERDMEKSLFVEEVVFRVLSAGVHHELKPTKIKGQYEIISHLYKCGVTFDNRFVSLDKPERYTTMCVTIGILILCRILQRVFNLDLCKDVYNTMSEQQYEGIGDFLDIVDLKRFMDYIILCRMEEVR